MMTRLFAPTPWPTLLLRAACTTTLSALATFGFGLAVLEVLR